MSKFWMVFRDGGRAPTYQHTSIDAAKSEATRVAIDSGCSTHVLESVLTCSVRWIGEPLSKEVEPIGYWLTSQMTEEIVKAHAISHPIKFATGLLSDNSARWGLWLMVDKGVDSTVGSCVPVGIREGGICKAICYGSEIRLDSIDENTRWFKLYADGSPMQSNDDIQF